jgi:pimeloyl-ACP methyl ester carboxylesterase
MSSASAGAPRWWGRPLAETRWTLELARLAVDPAFLGIGVPRGDGRPVVLMPGFMAGDHTLGVMAGWLYRLGYSPRTCGFVANVDCSERAFEKVTTRVASLHRRHHRRVALVGHSRGGHLARAVAASRPEQVSHAISLGADLQHMFGVSEPTRLAVAGTRRALHLAHRVRAPECLTEACTCAFAQHYAAPFPSDRVRLTSVYSRGDGVVCWERSIVPDANCVEVSGSHVGLIFNRKSYRAIAAALAEPELAP